MEAHDKPSNLEPQSSTMITKVRINDLQLATHQLLTFEHGPSNVLMGLFHAQQRVDPGSVSTQNAVI